MCSDLGRPLYEGQGCSAVMTIGTVQCGGRTAAFHSSSTLRHVRMTRHDPCIGVERTLLLSGHGGILFRITTDIWHVMKSAGLHLRHERVGLISHTRHV